MGFIKIRRSSTQLPTQNTQINIQTQFSISCLCSLDKSEVWISIIMNFKLINIINCISIT